MEDHAKTRPPDYAFEFSYQSRLSVSHIECRQNRIGVIKLRRSGIRGQDAIIMNQLIPLQNSTTMWSYNFYLAGFIGLSTGLMFQIFASADVQEWGLAPKATPDDKYNQTHHDPTRSQDHKMGTSAV